MSRRRGEFEHRTSIFEGAFRAWAHLGGIEPEDLETKTLSELDPLTNPIENDTRLPGGSKARNPDGTVRREYPYEPLPRSGLAHPYVQAILSPWLGPDADNEAIQLGLTTLRTWWQHRRKGESGSAIAALGTEKMKGVVEGYTRHFFALSYCLIVNDKEQPPRTLHGKMKELEKIRSKRGAKKRARGPDDPVVSPQLFPQISENMTAQISADLTDSNLSPLERLHAAQRRQLAKNNFHHDQLGDTSQVPVINMPGAALPSVPGKIELPEVVQAVRTANQLVHRGPTFPNQVSTSAAPQPRDLYGDGNKTPVVFVSPNGDIQIAMSIEGITCAHCVKIVETVLKGCNGNKSPIEGLLDAAADRQLNSVLIKIDKASNAKRIAFESARNLAMVGYTATAKEMNVVDQGADKKVTMELGQLSTAFEIVANTETKDAFDWSIPCTCPDNGVLREDCARHSQMNRRIFDAFETREQQVKEYVAGCGMKYGMECTCGPSCRCANCPRHSAGVREENNTDHQPILEDSTSDDIQADMFGDPPLQLEQRMDFFDLETPSGGTTGPTIMRDSSAHAKAPSPPSPQQQQVNNDSSHRVQRNASLISYNNGGLRGMSLTSETTFGRAMSGLSALSIDWENLDDFDVEVDHSAHIVNNPKDGVRRSSLRRSFIAQPRNLEVRDNADGSSNVSFKE